MTLRKNSIYFPVLKFEKKKSIVNADVAEEILFIEKTKMYTFRYNYDYHAFVKLKNVYIISIYV